MIGLLTYTPTKEQAEVLPVSPAVEQMKAVFMNDSCAEAVGSVDSIAVMSQELAGIVNDGERAQHLEQALVVWGNSRGRKKVMAYFAYQDGSIPTMVHGGVSHCFANAAISGKDRFKFQSIQFFIDISLTAKNLLEEEVSGKDHVLLNP